MDRSHRVRHGIIGGRSNTRNRVWINFAFETRPFNIKSVFEEMTGIDSSCGADLLNTGRSQKVRLGMLIDNRRNTGTGLYISLAIKT